MFDDVRPQAPPTSPLPSHAVREALVRAGLIVPLGDADPAAPADDVRARFRRTLRATLREGGPAPTYRSPDRGKAVSR
jgi:hypothetical protein